MNSKLKEQRERNGMDRGDLAATAQISAEYLRRLETDKRPPVPSLAVARRIADALGVTVDDVFPAEVANKTSAPAGEAA